MSDDAQKALETILKEVKTLEQAVEQAVAAGTMGGYFYRAVLGFQARTILIHHQYASLLSDSKQWEGLIGFATQAIEQMSDEDMRYSNILCRTNRDMASWYHRRGIAKSNLRRYQEAIEDFDMATQDNRAHDKEHSSELIAERGWAKFALGRLEDARQDFYQAIESNRSSSNSKLQYYCGLINEMLELPKEAEQDYQKALQEIGNSFSFMKWDYDFAHQIIKRLTRLGVDCSDSIETFQTMAQRKGIPT